MHCGLSFTEYLNILWSISKYVLWHIEKFTMRKMYFYKL